MVTKKNNIIMKLFFIFIIVFFNYLYLFYKYNNWKNTLSIPATVAMILIIYLSPNHKIYLGFKKLPIIEWIFVFFLFTLHLVIPFEVPVIIKILLAVNYCLVWISIRISMKILWKKLRKNGGA